MNVTLEHLRKAQEYLRDLRWHYWRDEVLFSWQWWWLLFWVGLLFWVWLKIVDRYRMMEMALFATVSLILISALDVLGGELVLWDYPSMLLPWGARILSVDAMMAIMYTMLYQWTSGWGTFLGAITALSLLFSFVLEPISIWMGVYQPYGWESLYSFPGYIIVALIIRWIVTRIAAAQKP